MEKDLLIRLLQDEKITALAEKLRFQEAIIDAAGISVISISSEGLITNFNPTAEKLLGYTAEDVVGKASPEIFHDAEELYQSARELSATLNVHVRPDYEALVAKAKYFRVPEKKEWTCVRKDGSLFTALVSVISLRDEMGSLTGYALIITDVTEQKKNREQIKKTEAEQQALMSSIDDVVFELDDQGRFIKIWTKSDDNLFFPREKIYGKTLSELFGEEFAKPFNLGIQRVLKTGEPFNHEYKTVNPGNEQWFNAKYSLIFENGEPTKRFIVSIENITERKKIELSLRASEEKFKLLAENLPGTVFLCENNETYTVIYLNDNIEQITGYKPEHFFNLTVNYSDLIHSDDQEMVERMMKKALMEKESYYLQYRIKHSSGAWRWIEETGVGVYRNGIPVMIEGYMTDITTRKHAEEELKRVAEENSRVFNNTISLNVIAGFDGYFKQLNPAWENTLGWTLDELKAKKFIEFVHPEDFKKTKKALDEITSGKIFSAFENRYQCRDGSYRWLLWNSSPDMARKLIYASAIDITDRKKSEDNLLISKKNLEVAALELQEQNKQLDEFAHIISHNLRSPVGNIKALINFLTENSTLSDYRTIFEKIKNVASNLNETMNDLLETLKVKKNTEIERIEIRFKDVLDKTIQSLEGELIELDAAITFDFNEAPKIYYSKPYLESIFQNLISNAIKYRSPERKPEIHLQTNISKHGIELRVRDNGLGIDLKKFGNKLFGLHKTFHENKEARGVGLFLTKMQVEALGGSIHVESEVNKGTTFVIQF